MITESIMTRIRLPVPAAGRSDHTLTRFEERFVYRISRGVPAGITALAGVVLLVACAAVLYTLVPPRPVREPAPAVIPGEVSVSLEEVQQALSVAGTDRAVVADTTVASAPSAATPHVDPSWAALADRVHAIRLLFPAPTYSWNDRYQTYCADRYFDYCFRTEQRRVTEGVSSLVYAAASMFDDGSQMEWVPETATRPEGYHLDVTGVDRKLAALGELEGILAAVPVAQRRQVASGWIGVRSAREAERNAAIAAEHARVANERAAEEARFTAAQAKRATLRSTSLTSIVGAIGSIWVLGLTLALLAIERNTRHLRSGTQSAGTGVTVRSSPLPEPAGR
jgi:hypothetical protein